MKCKNARILISAAADGELCQRETLALGEHLASCAECGREQRTVTGLRRALTAWEPSEPAESLTDAFMLRLSRERETASHSWRALFFSKLPAYGLASAAAAVILVGVYVATMRPVGQAPSVQPPSIASNHSTAERPKPTAIATNPEAGLTPEAAGVQQAPPRVRRQPERGHWMAYVSHRERRHHVERWATPKSEQPKRYVVAALDPTTADAARAIADSANRDGRHKVAEEVANLRDCLAKANTKVEEAITEPGARSHTVPGDYDSGSNESPG